LKVPGGSDVKFLAKLLDKQKPGKPDDKNTVMVGTRVRNAFCIRHFAGQVTYDVDGFLDKNRDTLTEDLVDMLRSSNHTFLEMLYPKDEAVTTGQRKASLAKQFQKQLKNLMGQLYATEPHYIRCIKPNDDKAPLHFVPRNCYEQLTYSGVFEAVAIRKKGFPFRLKHQDFVDRYEKCLKKNEISDGGSDLKKRSTNIAKHLKLDMNNFKVGKTLVLYRAREYRSMELTWSVVTKHDTIIKRMKELVLKNPNSMSKEDKDDFCMDLAYAVREASLFKIKGNDVEKGKKLLDQLIDERMDPETKKLLNDAIKTKNLTKLREAIDRCESKGIEGSLVSQCRELQSLVEDAEGALSFAMKSMEENNLERALQMCDDFDYHSDNEKAARKLLKNVLKAIKGIKQAFKKAPRYKASMMSKVVKFCKSFGYNTEDFQTLSLLEQKISSARKQLNKAYDAVNEDKLRKAIALCNKKRFNGTKYYCQLVEDCQDLMDRIIMINKEALVAKKQCIGEQVEVIVSAAERINLSSDIIDYLKKLLNGPKKNFLKKQIEGAKKEGDISRASRVQIELHDLECKSNSDKLKVESFAQLKAPMNWANGSAKKASTMLQFITGHLSNPLTRRYDTILDNHAKKEMKKKILHSFSTVQKAMGQRNTSRITLRLQEIGIDAVNNHNGKISNKIHAFTF
jgi:myosin heavy subunit